jgi:AcrR family transcriptional regulator
MPAHGESPSTPDTAQVISDAAVRLFHDHGYHGTSIRDIAGEAKVGIATLFHHHQSKAELLRRIMDTALDDLLAEMEPAVAAAGDDPTARLSAVVRTYVRRQCESPMHNAIATSEMRSLEPPLLDEPASKRDRVHELFESAIVDGAASGTFVCDVPEEAARAVHAMCSAVSGWYRDDGRMAPDEVAELYVGMALRVVGARELAPAP